MNKVKKIIQIMPATGWKARYKEDEGDEEKSTQSYNMVCFALCEMEDGTQEIKGMEDEYGDIEFSDKCSNFDRYVFDKGGI